MRGGLLLLGADLAQDRRHLADDEGERDEDGGEDHPGEREDDVDAVVACSHPPNQPLRP